MDIRYNYEKVPTLREFAKSDVFFRAIMGPVGCLPGDTEFLTTSGWKRMDAWRPGDLVAQWHQSGRLEFVNPQFHSGPAPEGFIQFDSGSLVMQLSPDHRVPHLNWDGRFQVKTAAEIERKPSKRKIITTFDPPLTDGLDMSDDLIRFAVMMHADGHYPKAGYQATITVRKEHKKIRIRYLLALLGVEFKERVYPQRPTGTIFSFIPPYIGKHFGAEWWGASRHQLDVIVDEMSYWDGLYDHEETRFSTSEKSDADFMQYAAHAIGRRATISVETYPDKPNIRPNYGVQIFQKDGNKNVATVRVDNTSISRIPAVEGRQYCFTVPTGFFLARCEDTIFVTGNSGKSAGSSVEIGRRAMAQRPSPDGIKHTRWCVIRNTFKQLQDTTIPTFFQWFPPQHFGKYNVADHRYVMEGLEGARVEILFRALDKPGDIANLLSLELTGAWINEMREVPWIVVDTLQTRLGRFPPQRDGGPTWFGMWGDTNAPDTDSKFYKFFEETDLDPAFAQLFKQPSGLAENAENLPNLPGGRQYYERLCNGKSKEWIDVYVKSEYGFVSDNKPIYPEYSDGIHLCDPDLSPISSLPIIRGWDVGFGGGCVLTQILPDGRWLIFDEIEPDGLGMDRFADQVLEYCARAFPKGATFEDYGDPAGQSRAQTDERTCFEIMQAKGIDILPGEQSPAIRQESVRKPLRTIVNHGKSQLALHPRCRRLRKGFMGGYHYRRLQTSAERYTDKPEKNEYAGLHDALQYPATQIFGAGLISRRVKDDYPTFQQRDERGRSNVTGY